ncbi:cbb3-type cytochrome oxidase assembly protein CcoS [Catenovulum adriaticum]|uniref:Cbb3-type cytochrome oxidase assembly protein CcoS n=1 Tax=Catenovulum adriaticum TaxID=2984846 RepID=A0ABY7AI98_9ALTE|nr:cbb3-type cytochrome oxidase assembly protein CcoS [Catenovulum sp. TS8]WAJ69045.1 cbb3-type cytochrome oxidase assembly protein CcoS [Catenovulum sp. TS8]
MNVIYVLIPLAIIIVLVAIAIFFWAVRKNQFDDLDRQGYEILFDDEDNSTEAMPKQNKPKGDPKNDTNQDNQNNASV